MSGSARPMWHPAILVGITLFLLELAPAAAIAAGTYSWTEIIVPNATVAAVWGLNDLDEVAISTSNGISGIYRHGRFTQLPAPPVGFQVSAMGINDIGIIVGPATTPPDTHEQGFILMKGQYRFFSRPGWQNTEPRSISPSGLLVGISYQDDFATSGAIAGFVYDPSTGNFTDVTPSGSLYTIAQGINRFGRISGSGEDYALGRYAFIWQLGALANDTGELVPYLDRIRLADGFANARGINDEGIVAGWGNSGGQTVGFVGSASRGYQLLVPPGGAAAGAATHCQGINNTRDVSCLVTDAAGNNRGFVGSPHGE